MAKTEAHTFIGILLIMILTGEWCTFLFNTFSNQAMAVTKYDFPKEVAQVYGGDDSIINSPVIESDFYKRKQKHFHLVSKPKISKLPTFVGWICTPKGLIKDPLVVYLRLKIAEERNNIPDVIESYYFDHLMTYSLTDHLHTYLNEHQLDAHQINTRMFLKYKKYNRFSTMKFKFGLDKNSITSKIEERKCEIQ